MRTTGPWYCSRVGASCWFALPLLSFLALLVLLGWWTRLAVDLVGILQQCGTALRVQAVHARLNMHLLLPLACLMRLFRLACSAAAATMAGAGLALRVLVADAPSFHLCAHTSASSPPLCVVTQHTNAVADVTPARLLPVLLKGTDAIVCRSLLVSRCGQYRSSLRTGSARAPQSLATCVLSNTSYRSATP